MIDIVTKMGADIRSLVLDALKLSAWKPRELLFLRSFLGSSARAQKIRENNEAAGLHVPAFLIASITSNCNLFCTGCYARANQACAAVPAGKPLTGEKWDALFHEATELGVSFILLAGGEPMLRQDVLDAAIKQSGILFPVFTNGTLMDRRSLDRFDKHRNLVPVVSLEGGEAATDARRGKGVYRKITETMRELRSKRILFGVSITVTKGNVVEVTAESFVQRLKEMGCGLIFYVEYVPSDNVSTGSVPTDAERAFLAARLPELRKSQKMLMISFPGDEKDYGGCLAAGRGFVHVNSDGSVEPCPFSPYSDTNLTSITLREALRSPFLTRMREGGMLSGEHAGGCLLFEKRGEVEEMLKNCKTGTD